MALRRHRFNAMGCPCELRLRTDTQAAFESVVAICVREVRRFDEKYSSYLPESVTSTVNRAAGREPLPIDAETAAILRYAGACHEQSGGLFDITSGAYRHVWRRGRTTLPSREELEAAAAKVGWSKVRFCEAQVFLPVAGMELDFGGVVKEYAADAAALLARKAGVDEGLVNLGGDVAVVGPRAKGRPWPIGITHPVRRDRAIATVSLTEGALATSGSYERFVEIGERRYSHLIDPRTGWPVEGLLSVSVVADRAVVAGALASIASLHPAEKGLAWLERCGAPYLAVDAQLRCHGHLADPPALTHPLRRRTRSLRCC